MQTRMDLMSWQDFERSVRQNKVVILPVGALLRHRVRRLLILDGHYENSLFLNDGVDLALREIQTNRAKVVIARWYELVPEAFFVKLFEKTSTEWPWSTRRKWKHH